MAVDSSWFLVREVLIDGLVTWEFPRNFRRRSSHRRTVGLLLAIGVPRGLRINPFVNLFAGLDRKIDEAHAGAFFSFANPVDFAGGFNGFEGAGKLETEG